MHQAIKPSLKPDADWPSILSEITTFMYDLHLNSVLRASEVHRRLKAMQAGLETFLQAYDQDDGVGEALKLHGSRHDPNLLRRVRAAGTEELGGAGVRTDSRL